MTTDEKVAAYRAAQADKEAAEKKFEEIRARLAVNCEHPKDLLFRNIPNVKADFCRLCQKVWLHSIGERAP